MKTIIKLNFGALFALAVLVCSCDKGFEIGILNKGDFGDTLSTLKTVAASAEIPFGLAVDYTLMKNNASYKALVTEEVSEVTFGYQMKHGAIVQDNGTLNFTKTDELVNICATAGLDIFGHTLVWHQNQNANYLKSFAGIIIPTPLNILNNPGFESGLSGWSTFNSGNPAGSATITTGSGSNEFRTGTGSVKVINPTAYPGSQWRVQVSSTAFATTPTKQYKISYWVKAASAGGSIRLSTGPTSAQYQGDQTIGTSWQQVTFIITANLSSTTFLFDMGQAANTYYIDDASVTEITVAPPAGDIAIKLDQAMKTFITESVTRYKGDVYAWDVVNEPMADNGTIRTNSNTTTTGSDVLVWSNYLGKDYALKAFQYAKTADPDALLFINDYSLESNTAKLDSLIKYVEYLNIKGAQVDGIGTQMHILVNTSYDGIDKAFQKLAGTGLKVRISELDIRINSSGRTGFTTTPEILSFQAAMYKYVIDSYIRNVPAAQRGGITVWGVTDADSWYVTVQNKVDFPLLFDNHYAKKPAFSAVGLSLSNAK